MRMTKEGHRVCRRVVTGNDADGKSGVVWDSDAPNTMLRATGSLFTEYWTVQEAPVDLSDEKDGSDCPLSISPPDRGYHFRIAQTPPEKAREIDAATIEKSHAETTTTGVTEHKEGGPHWNMHRTASVDYAFNVYGERILILEDSEVVLNKGDAVIQLANWHSWTNRSDSISGMAYLMIGGELSD